jgi:phosphoglycolate phosphatase-like HAD superfamily hydrolase
MKRPVVMFDVDGVLADFLHGYRSVQELLGRTPTTEPRWDAYLDEQVWKFIKDSSTFWQHLPSLVHRTTALRIDSLHRDADVYFVTNRVGRGPKQQTETWLRHLGIFDPTVILSGRKGEMAAALGADFSIDDKAGNAVFMSYHSPKTKSYLLDAPYNQINHDVIGGTVRRVKSVDEFLNEVTRA